MAFKLEPQATATAQSSDKLHVMLYPIVMLRFPHLQTVLWKATLSSSVEDTYGKLDSKSTQDHLAIANNILDQVISGLNEQYITVARPQASLPESSRTRSNKWNTGHSQLPIALLSRTLPVPLSLVKTMVVRTQLASSSCLDRTPRDPNIFVIQVLELELSKHARSPSIGVNAATYLELVFAGSLYGKNTVYRRVVPHQRC